MMTVQRIDLSTANAAVASWHRHSRQIVGHLFSLGLFEGFTFHGAAIIGRPVARMLDDGQTVEVTRLVTDGTRNACSMLYAASCREARKRGYQRVVTYTLATETGASVRSAGFHLAAEVAGRQWNTPSRPRKSRAAADRLRWERAA